MTFLANTPLDCVIHPATWGAMGSAESAANFTSTFVEDDSDALEVGQWVGIVLYCGMNSFYDFCGINTFWNTYV